MMQLIALIGMVAGFVAGVAYWVRPAPDEAVRKKNRMNGILFFGLGLINLFFAIVNR